MSVALNRGLKKSMGYNIKEQCNNVNVVTNNNYNVNKYDKSKFVELTARVLVEKLDNPNAYAYYCKVAYKVPEHRIWLHLESALRGDNPQKLFTWLCQRDINAQS